jgi:hypothetical protein
MSLTKVLSNTIYAIFPASCCGYVPWLFFVHPVYFSLVIMVVISLASRDESSRVNTAENTTIVLSSHIVWLQSGSAVSTIDLVRNSRSTHNMR